MFWFSPFYLTLIMQQSHIEHSCILLNRRIHVKVLNNGFKYAHQIFILKVSLYVEAC